MNRFLHVFLLFLIFGITAEAVQLRKIKNEEAFYNGLAGGVHTKVQVPESMCKYQSDDLHFRGCSGDHENIFANGFIKRNSPLVYRIDYQDICPSSGTCLTSKFDVAALFPIILDQKKVREDQVYKEPPRATNVYVVLPGVFFKTYEIQKKFAERKVRDASNDHVTKAIQNLYAKEIAALEIPTNKILGCMEVEREWAGTDFESGGTYKIINFKKNDNYNGKNPFDIKYLLHLLEKKGMSKKDIVEAAGYSNHNISRDFNKLKAGESRNMKKRMINLLKILFECSGNLSKPEKEYFSHQKNLVKEEEDNSPKFNFVDFSFFP